MRGCTAQKLSVQEKALTRFLHDGDILDWGLEVQSEGEIIELKSPPIAPCANLLTIRSGIVTLK